MRDQPLEVRFANIGVLQQPTTRSHRFDQTLIAEPTINEPELDPIKEYV